MVAKNEAGGYRVSSTAQDLAHRVAEGSLSEQFVLAGLRRLQDGFEWSRKLPKVVVSDVIMFFDEEGFERQIVPYAPSFKELKVSSGFGWNSNVTEGRFKRRPFEQGDYEILTKLHAPMRLIWSLEAMHEFEDMTCYGATIREGIAWAQTHNVNDYPSDIVIALLGSAWRNSEGRLCVPCFYRCDGRWYLSCRWAGGQWKVFVQFLAVRRYF